MEVNSSDEDGEEDEAALEQRDDQERAVEGEPPVHARQPEADGGDPADDGNVREPVRELVLPALSVEGLDEQLGDAISLCRRGPRLSRCTLAQ